MVDAGSIPKVRVVSASAVGSAGTTLLDESRGSTIRSVLLRRRMGFDLGNAPADWLSTRHFLWGAIILLALAGGPRRHSGGLHGETVQPPLWALTAGRRSGDEIRCDAQARLKFVKFLS